MAQHPQQSDFELLEKDLLGYAVDDIACVQCGGVFCGLRVGRIFKGKPLILCSRKDEVKEILARKHGQSAEGER